MNQHHLHIKVLLMACVLVAILLSSGCLGGKSNVKSSRGDGMQPEWVLTTPVERGFLYGVGSVEVFGGNQNAAVVRAKDIARIELVKQIEVNVSGVVEQEISETVRDGSSSLTEELRQQVKSQVPEFKLNNVNQVDSYASGRNVSVLVRLDVNKELAILKGKISDLDSQIGEYETQFQNNPGTGLSTIRQIAPVLVLIDQRGELQARYNALAGVSEPVLPAAIRAFVTQVYQRISQLQVSVEAETAHNEALQTSLIANLTEKGMHVSQGLTDVTIVYNLSTNVVHRDQTNFALTEGNIKIKDENGKIVSAFRAKAKGTSVDRREAQARSVIKLANKLGKEMMKSLF